MKLDNTVMNFSGTGAIARRSVENTPSLIKKLDGVYEEFAKLVFLFDVSGSMGIQLTVNYLDQYLWPVEKLVEIRQKVAAAVAAYNTVDSEDDNEVAERDPLDKYYLALADTRMDTMADLQFNPADDEDLKTRIIQNDLMDALGIFKVPGAKHTAPPTRMSVTKKLAKQELEKRFQKFPDSKVSVIRFGSFAETLFDSGTAADLWPKLDELEIGCGGGTDILTAVRAGMDTCRKNPSSVGLHHFVIVSDGEDYNADRELPNWIPSLKESGIVMDYIHIGDAGINTGVKAVCEATGGTFVVVTTEKELEAKFFEAVTRKCLPPPADAK